MLWQALRGKDAHCPISVTFPQWLWVDPTLTFKPLYSTANKSLSSATMWEKVSSNSLAQALSVFGLDLFRSFSDVGWVTCQDKYACRLHRRTVGSSAPLVVQITSWFHSQKPLFSPHLPSHLWLIVTFLNTEKERGIFYFYHQNISDTFWLLPQVHVSASKSRPLIFERSLSMQRIICTLSQPYNVCSDKFPQPQHDLMSIYIVMYPWMSDGSFTTKKQQNPSSLEDILTDEDAKGCKSLFCEFHSCVIVTVRLWSSTWADTQSFSAGSYILIFATWP